MNNTTNLDAILEARYNKPDPDKQARIQKKYNDDIQEISNRIIDDTGGDITNDNISTRELLQELLKEIIEVIGMNNIISKPFNLCFLMTIRTFKRDLYSQTYHNISREYGPESKTGINLRTLLMSKFPMPWLLDLQNILDNDKNPVTSFLHKLLTYIFFLSYDKTIYKRYNHGDKTVRTVMGQYYIDSYTIKNLDGNTLDITIDTSTLSVSDLSRTVLCNITPIVPYIKPIRLIHDDDQTSITIATSDISEEREIKASPEQVQEILHIIQLGLSEYSYDKNIARPLKVTIDISEINIFERINKRLPEEYNDTIILTIDGKDYLEDIMEHIRQYILQDSDAEVELHSRLGSYTEHMANKNDEVYNPLINNIFAIFYDKIIHYFIHQFINKTPYLQAFFENCKGLYRTIAVTSANHKDNDVFMKIDYVRTYGKGLPSVVEPTFLKAILFKTAPTLELKEKILAIDDNVLEYIGEEIDQYCSEAYYYE